MIRHGLLFASVATFLFACGDNGGTTARAPIAPPSVPTAVPPEPGTTSGSVPAQADGAPYPIVLLHGMAGFDKLQVPLVSVVYFNAVKDDLAQHGEPAVYVTVAPPYDTSESRAAAIKPQIEAILKRTGKAKVNLVGHSQGGMDARVLASPAGLGMGDVIASVTTIATPHRGSRVADAVLQLLDNVPAQLVDDVTSAVLKLVEKTAYDVDNDPNLRGQLVQLSENYMTRVFNPKYVDDPRVAYSSYGGRTNFEKGTGECASALYPDDPSKLDAAQPLLYPTAVFLEEGDGKANDGLVTVASAKWGTFLQCVPADHLAEVGQLFQSGTDPISKFDHLAFFRSVVARIRAAGY